MRRGQGARRRRCRDIVDDELRRDRPQPPSAQKVAAGRPHLLRCSSSPIARISSSERLESEGVALATNIIVFMEVSTKGIQEGRLKTPTLLAWGFHDPSAVISGGMELFGLLAPSVLPAQMHIFNT